MNSIKCNKKITVKYKEINTHLELTCTMHLKILSYNWHEPYLSLVSKIGHTFLIVEPEISEGVFRRWDKNMRPIPENVILVSQKEAISQLDEGMVDLVIAHNIKDLINVHEYCLPKILVFHNKLSTEIKLGNNKVSREDYLKNINPLLKNVKKIFISENKQRDWGLTGDVILPGIDVNDYGEYRGDNPSILRVGNLIKERDIMMGFSKSESIIEGLPSITLGLNPTIPGARMSSGFNDLLDHYRSLRVYVHTTSNDYEDGYNLALLEAMAVGMPVISISNKTSPIVNGINGYISSDIKYLKECAISLLGDKNLANSLSQNARDTIVEKFSQSKFLNLWISIIEKSIIEFLDYYKKELPKESMEINSEPENKSIDQYFKNVRDDIVSLVPDNALDILEIGCAAGMTGNELKKKGAYVAGVELDSKAVVEAKKVLDEVVEGNIEILDLSFEGRKFDCILFADVLEHLIDPLAVLKKTRQHLRSNGTVIASIPNVQYIGLVSQLVEGNWTYQDEGILDRTHLRFFTYPEILKLFDDAGYKISCVNETLDPQYKNMTNNKTTLNIGRLSIRDLSQDELKKFFVYQYKITANLKNFDCDDKFSHSIKESCMKNILEEGQLLENNELYNDAIKTYSTVDSDHVDYSEILARIANCYMQLQDRSRAKSYYKKSLELDPQGYVASVGLGLLEIQLNQLDDAIKRLSDVIRNCPDSDKAFSAIGIALSQKNKRFDAMNAFSQALKLNIENKPAMAYLLDLSYQSGQFDQIENAMNRYLVSYPNATDILFGLGGIQYKSNRIKEAQKTIKLILELNPNHKDANIMFNKIEVEKEKVC